MELKSRLPSGEKATPSKPRVSGGRESIRWPSRKIAPAQGRTNPITALMLLLFPATLAPSSSTVSPLSTFIVAPSTALMPPYRIWRLSMDSIIGLQGFTQIGAYDRWFGQHIRRRALGKNFSSFQNYAAGA